MIVQFSSGMGPAECELAVAKLFETIRTECPDLTLIYCVSGKKTGIFQSILFQTQEDLSALEGSVLWICPSVYRIGHKRKNWYVDVSLMAEQGHDAIGWAEHARIVRGNPVRVYEGVDFHRKA